MLRSGCRGAADTPSDESQSFQRSAAGMRSEVTRTYYICGRHNVSRRLEVRGATLVGCTLTRIATAPCANAQPATTVLAFNSQLAA